MKRPTLAEHCYSSRNVFSGNLLQVYQDEVVLPDGRNGVREYIIHPGAVVVIPWLPERRLVLERQYRHPLKREFLELPAGKLTPGEDPLAAAQRELLEETGYSATRWHLLCRIHPCIGYANEEMFLYMAEELTLTRPNWDEDELIEVVELPLDAAMEGIRTGLITDAKTVVGLFWAEKWVRQEWVLEG
ncbi:Methanol dehydrogenase activator [Gammaproteobacteria bacterium]